MSIAKYILGAVLLSALLALPVSSALTQSQERLEKEQKRTKELRLQIDSLKVEQEQEGIEYQQLQEENLKHQQENEELKKQLQSKREEKERLAQKQREEKTKPAVAVSGGNCESYRGLVAKYFAADQIDNALLTMKKESGCNTMALSSTQDRGLLQINRVHASKVGGDLNALYDPETNIRVAAQIYSGRGWNAWYAVCPSSGSNPYGLCG